MNHMLYSFNAQMSNFVNLSKNYQVLPQEPLTQYWVYLNSFECILHAEVKYDNDIFQI